MERRQAVKTMGLTIGMFFGLSPVNVIGSSKNLIEEQLKFFRKELTKSQFVEFIVLVTDFINEELSDLPELKDKESAGATLFEIVKAKIFDQEISIETCELLKDGLKSFEAAVDSFENEKPIVPHKERLERIETTGVNGQFIEAKNLIFYLKNDLIKDICEQARKELA